MYFLVLFLYYFVGGGTKTAEPVPRRAAVQGGTGSAVFCVVAACG